MSTAPYPAAATAATCDASVHSPLHARMPARMGRGVRVRSGRGVWVGRGVCVGRGVGVTRARGRICRSADIDAGCVRAHHPTLTASLSNDPKRPKLLPCRSH